MKERWRSSYQAAALLIIDLVSYYSALFLASATRSNIVNFLTKDRPEFLFSYQYYISIWWIPVIFLVIMVFERLYTTRYPFWEEIKTIIKAVTITILFVFFMITVRSMYGNISRLVLIFLWVYLCVVLILTRYWGKRLMYLMGIWKEKVLVLGTGQSATDTVRGLTNEKQLGYSVLGFLDESNGKRKLKIDSRTYPVFGGIKNFTKFISMLKVSTVIISLPDLSRDELAKLTNHVQKYAKNVLLVPDLVGIAQINTELHYLFMQKLFLLKIKNNLHSTMNRIFKAMFDLFLGIIILPLAVPFLAVIAVLIKLDSPGPVFIRQERIGRFGRIFKCIKFRTMFTDQEKILHEYLKKDKSASIEWKTYKKLRKYDPRVTRIGLFLRKTSLDESPQIFNVLKFDMSLVGPRPYLPNEESDFEDYRDIIFMTKPGLTGLWQVSGRNELIFSERTKLDTWYVENWSVWLDLIILFKTISVVLQRKGAY
jgi:undecaprenyl-phosphate galactose phosphotransferase